MTARPPVGTVGRSPWHPPATPPPTSPSSRGSSRSASGPGMYIGGTDARGLPPPRSGRSSTTPSTRSSTATPRASRSRSHTDGKTVDGRRQRPRHPGRHPPEVQEVGARADPHHAPRGRQVRAGRTTSTRAACTASARRWSTRSSEELIANVRRDGERVASRRYARGKATVEAEEGSATGARHAARRSASGPTRRSSAKQLASTPSAIRERLEAKTLPAPRPRRSSSRRDAAAGRRRETFAHDGGIAEYLAEARRRARQDADRTPSGFVLRAQDDDPRLELALAVDRGDRRARPLATSTASRRTSAARTRTACKRGHRQGGAQLHRRRTSSRPRA